MDDYSGTAWVSPPKVPSLVMAPPTGTTVTVIPVGGPAGPPGAPGPPGDPGGALAYRYSTSNPAMVHQIVHGLTFRPAGIVCLDADGASLLGWSVTYPSTGITEVSFGAACTPTIFLS